ncbi:MAG: hypothetical protein ACREMY_14745, partial [bacterium]
PWHTRVRVWWEHSDENQMGIPALLKSPRVWLDWHFGLMGGGKIAEARYKSWYAAERRAGRA